MKYFLTFVMPISPMFSLYDVKPDPHPHIPARTQPIPSTRIPAIHANSKRLSFVLDYGELFSYICKPLFI